VANYGRELAPGMAWVHVGYLLALLALGLVLANRNYRRRLAE